MNFLINFANEKFKDSQKFNSVSGRNIGGFDGVIEYSPSSIDDAFSAQFSNILSCQRGAGYWLWKSYIVNDVLNKVSNGDVIMYSDSGCHFIRDARPLLELTEKFNQDVIPFELELPEGAWTKRDAFHYMGCDGLGFENTNQRLASFIIIRKSDLGVKFAREYLHYSCDKRIISDDSNICGLPNYHGFTDHRHDQSIYSLLTKKYKLQAFRDPSQWGNPRKQEFANSKYSQIIEHTRHKEPKLKDKIKLKLKRVFRS